MSLRELILKEVEKRNPASDRHLTKLLKKLASLSKEVIMLYPWEYTDKEGGSFKSWDNSPITCHQLKKLVGKGDPYLNVLVNSTRVHSLIFEASAARWEAYARWDCINGWTTTISQARKNFPLHEITYFLREVIKDIPNLLDASAILDPCAGGDLYNKMSYPEALKSMNADGRITTVDYREDSLADIKADYLTYEFANKFDLIITNPPFTLALPIIQKALRDTVIGGHVIMLLRLNFLGSKARINFWYEHMPKYIYVHHQRISFTGGATDSIEYMHAIWEVGKYTKFSNLRVI